MRRNRLCIFRRAGYTVASDLAANGDPLDSTDLLQLTGIVGAVILIIPGIIIGLRNRRTALRNIAIWVALIGVGALLFWLLARPK